MNQMGDEIPAQAMGEADYDEAEDPTIFHNHAVCIGNRGFPEYMVFSEPLHCINITEHVFRNWP